jgi:hypothetical protein
MHVFLLTRRCKGDGWRGADIKVWPQSRRTYCLRALPSSYHCRRDVVSHACLRLEDDCASLDAGSRDPSTGT